MSEQQALSVRKSVLAVFKRDVLAAFRQRGEMLNPVIFFLMVVTMMPLGISPDGKTLAGLAPGLLWVIALLASMLSLDGLFRSDYEDGSLEQMILSPQPLYFLVLAKTLAHWVTTGLPLTLVAPLLGIMLSLPAAGFIPLMLSLLLGSLVLSLIGAIGLLTNALGVRHSAFSVTKLGVFLELAVVSSFRFTQVVL